MALTTCPDCGREISDQAPTCPQCGHPLCQARHQGTPVPIEKTGKRFKAGEALGTLGLLGGLGLCFVNFYLGGALVAGSLGVLTWATVGAWWHHD